MDTRTDLASTVTDVGDDLSSTYLDRRQMASGAALMTGGLIIWLAGAAVGMLALLNGCRRYLASREEPPRETARRRWEQTRTAVGAGVGAWQRYGRS